MRKLIRAKKQPSKLIPFGLPKVCPECGMKMTAGNYRVERGRLGRFFEKLQLPLFLSGSLLVFGVMLVFFVNYKQLDEWGIWWFGMSTWSFSVLMIPAVIEGIVLITPRVRRGHCLCGWKKDFPFPKKLWIKHQAD